jgi:hypothetical protein
MKSISLAGMPGLILDGKPLSKIRMNKAIVSCGEEVLGKVTGVLMFPDGRVDIQIKKTSLRKVIRKVNRK